MDVSGIFNLYEASVWGAAAAVMFVRSGREAAPIRRLGRKTAGVLVVFSATDLMEIRTGAWWDPWWLLALKAACVAALLWAGVEYWRLKR
jgi:hypothetical protein